ncbi:MAG: ATP-binding cassette domain-containing protein, partial [Actinomycetota bacterium]
MSDRVSVSVRDLHVVYRVFEDARPGFKQLFARGRVTRESRRIHAVRGVSFDVAEGESLGLVGSNGSGKSTLLGALTGLLPVESGSVRVRSRPTLLGVNAALRPALSGRRNIIIGGLAMGLSRREIDRRVEEIVEFAGLEEFIDLPLRTYSSGMRARLTFSIATAQTPDILLIDEALAVGDAEFRARSAERIAKIRAEAGTVILVSHDLAEIERSCDRALWLERGEVELIGEPDQVLAAYRN